MELQTFKINFQWKWQEMDVTRITTGAKCGGGVVIKQPKMKKFLKRGRCHEQILEYSLVV